jgi:hypothetical protein
MQKQLPKHSKGHELDPRATLIAASGKLRGGQRLRCDLRDEGTASGRAGPLDIKRNSAEERAGLGGQQQRQQADIERAKTLWAEYRARKAAAANDHPLTVLRSCLTEDGRRILDRPWNMFSLHSDSTLQRRSTEPSIRSFGLDWSSERSPW